MGINEVILLESEDNIMKTAISIVDKTFLKAEDLSKRLGISRSKLYTLAVEEFIESHSDEQVTELLNQVYDTEDSSIAPDILHAQLKVSDEDADYETW
jgi:hypothetical protein